MLRLACIIKALPVRNIDDFILSPMYDHDGHTYLVDLLDLWKGSTEQSDCVLTGSVNPLASASIKMDTGLFFDGIDVE